MNLWHLKVLLLFLLIHATESAFPDTYQWINIDCGAESYTLDTKNLINWETDTEYIQTGKNKNVTEMYTNITMQMKTLRYFPENTSPNCYSFLTDGIEKYIVRASFYYGNYDGLLKPPTFDVSVNGFKWMTVVTNSSQDEEPIVIEGIFSPSVDQMRVCLESPRDGDVPFISSLEVAQLPFNTYSLIELRTAFLLQQRTTFGRGEDVVYTGNYTDDRFNRIWKAKGFPNHTNMSTSLQFSYYYVDNEPPYAVLGNAIEASSLFDPIILPFNLSQTNQSLCAILYFLEINNSRQVNDSREFQIDISGQKNMTTVNLQMGEPLLVTLYPEWVVGPVNITMSAVQGSTLPPMINAMEVYTVMEMDSVPSPTSEASRILLSFTFLVLCCFSALF